MNYKIFIYFEVEVDHARVESCFLIRRTLVVIPVFSPISNDVQWHTFQICIPH